MGQNPQSAIIQMRKSVQNLGFSTEMYGDPTLMRFLTARSMDTEKATKMFVQWRKWREEFVPRNYISDSEVPDELNAEKIYLQGLSKKGNPLLIVMANKHYPSKDQLQFKKFIVYLLDKSIASSFKGKEVGNEMLIGIIDLQHLAYKNVDPRGLITGFQFLQAYYPQRLSKLYLIHMPWFFVSIWKFISRFLEKDTLQKIVIVTTEEERRSFIREVGEETLPEEYGGRAKLVPIQDFVLNAPT